MKFLHTVLDNGLTVIGEYNPSALSMAAGYFVRTGGRDETSEVSGVSHFLEHMLFKGSDRRNAADVNREFDEIGADYNASTSEENTIYYGAVLPEHQHALVDLLTDMMHPALPQEDYDTEKKVILEEIALYKDLPQFMVMEEARTLYYRGHPLGQSVLGTAETISALQRDQMYGYWQQRYASNNLVLALTGNFDWEERLDQVRHLTRRWQRAETPRSHPAFAAVPQVRVVPDEKIHRAHLCFLAPGVPAQSNARYVADVIGDIAGGGDGSRLYWELVEPGIADVVRLGHDEADGDGVFMAYASCDPERAQDVVDRVRSVLTKLQDEGCTADEIERTKRKAASALVIGSETPLGRLTHLGFDWQYRSEYLPLDTVIDQYLAVTLEQARDFLAARPFDRMTVVALGPVETLN